MLFRSILDSKNLASILSDYSNNYEYTSDGIFRRIIPTRCPTCNSMMVHNGYNNYTKKGLGIVKIGRYICSICKTPLEEERAFWEKLKDDIKDWSKSFYQILRTNNVSYYGISDLMSMIYPKSKDTIFREHQFDMDMLTITPPPRSSTFQVISYDEQFPKKGRTQQFRLTIFDFNSRTPIADEIFSTINANIVLDFFERNVDSTIPTFLVTDLKPKFVDCIRGFFGKNLIHQYCLLHLNKRITNDFPKESTIEQLLNEYLLLGIFYDRDEEITSLRSLLLEEKQMKGKRGYSDWLKCARSAFYDYVHELKLQRRRINTKMPMRTYSEAKLHFEKLMDNYENFDKAIKKRLKMISKHWDKFTAFYHYDNVPCTNNLIENYFSITLKNQQKKQLRTERGIVNQLKLGGWKKSGGIKYQGKTIFEILSNLRLFLKPG